MAEKEENQGVDCFNLNLKLNANLNELKQHCKEKWNKFPVIKSYLLKVIDAGGGSCIILSFSQHCVVLRKHYFS